MINYIYDNTFEGLLTAIYDAYYKTPKPDKIIKAVDYEYNFLDTNIQIVTDSQKQQKVSNAIRQKISDDTLEYAYYAYLTEIDNISTEIYKYLRLGFIIGFELNKYLTEPCVMSVYKAYQKVTGEIHMYHGLLRFKQLKNNIFYASIEPDHDILELMSEHFMERLSDQRWVIHDIKRNKALIYDTSKCYVELLPEDSNLSFNLHSLKDEQANFEELWKLYFKHISIESKRNIKLQRQHMPARYWYHLTEKRF